jgi:tRNA-splicing ligase RtcB
VTAPGFIVKGLGEEASVNSASHGARRRVSKTCAIKTITHSQLNDELAKLDKLQCH